MRLSILLVRSLIAAVAVLSLSPSSAAQVRHPGEPAADRVDGDPPTVTIPAPDVDALLAEDAANRAMGAVGPLRYGVMVDTPLVFEDRARWDVTNDGEHYVARLRLSAPGAYSLGVEFAEYDMHPEGRLFLYDDTGRNVLGAYTQEERIPTGEFVVEPFPGDTVVLEYSQPSWAEPRCHMALRGVIYDYADVFAMELGLTPTGGDGEPEGGCTIHVNCAPGDPFELQKRATVRTFFGGGLCSGVLLNNTLEDETQFLYTANHCGTGSTVVVRFNYQTPGCGGGGAPTNQNVAGAQLLASDVDTDSRLLRITGNIPDSYNPYYSGWSRSSSSLSFGMSMHHPGGGPKMISIDSNGGGQGTGNFIGIGLVRVWVMSFQTGGSSPGSSGGPLFDQNNRVRGALTGGNSCTDGLYGRFHNFWLDTNIANHLDPNSSGVTNLNGYDPFADVNAAVLGSVNPPDGAAGGFTPVTLSGSGFDGTSAVTFGGTPALGFAVVNDTTITTTAPAGPLGSTVDVAVTDGFGTSTLASAYTYTANPTPNVDTISPDTGHVDGGTAVTISGPSVVGVTDVTFDGLSGTGLTIVDANTLTVTTPAQASVGPVDVAVIGTGSDTLLDGFAYFLPGQFISIEPGHPGALFAPLLTGSGSLVPGGSGFTLQVLFAPPNGVGAMFWSVTEGAAPFKGGFLYTVPILLQIPMQANILGQILIPGIPVDPSIPGGLELITQFAFVDASASAGVSLSNGLKIVFGDV